MRIFSNLTAVTMDSQRRILSDAAIAINGAKIVAVDHDATLKARYPGAEIVDSTNLVALPGFIDTHAHADQSLLRGLGDEMHWHPFLDCVVSPWLAKRDPADSVLANTLSMIEMIRTGTTCFVSPNADPRDDYSGLTAAVAEAGIRAIFCRFIMAKENDFSAGAANEAVAEASAEMARWHGGAKGNVTMWFGLDVPRRPGDLIYPHFYREVAEEARRSGAGIVYHFCSEFEDSIYAQNTFGMRPAEWSRDNYALGPNVLLIGGCWMNPVEMRILADTGTHLAHSPVAHMKMATGILPLPDVRAAGVNVTLGTDGGLNNNTHDMFAEMKACCLLQNSNRRSAKACTALEALEMATINGAKAIGRAHELGSIEAGKLADVTLLDLNRPHTAPTHSLLSNIVFAANPSNVHTVMIGGRIVFQDNKVLGVDETAIIARVHKRAPAIRQQLGLIAHP